MCRLLRTFENGKVSCPTKLQPPGAEDVESTTDQPLAKKDCTFCIALTLQGRYAPSAFVALPAVWSTWPAARTKPGHVSCQSVLLSRLLQDFAIQILTTDNVAAHRVVGQSVAGVGL